MGYSRAAHLTTQSCRQGQGSPKPPRPPYAVPRCLLRSLCYTGRRAGIPKSPVALLHRRAPDQLMAVASPFRHVTAAGQGK